MNEESSPSRLRDLRHDLQEIQNRIGEIESELGSLEKASQATNGGNGTGGRLDLAHINQSVAELASLSSQEAILTRYLEETQHFVQRGILFLRDNGHYTAWKSIGFSPELAVEEASDAVQRAAAEHLLSRHESGLEESFPWLADSGPLPLSAVCVPMVFDDTAPVVLYADSGEGISEESLELLTQLTVLVLKNHYLSHVANRRQPREAELEQAESSQPSYEGVAAADTAGLATASAVEEPVEAETEVTADEILSEGAADSYPEEWESEVQASTAGDEPVELAEQTAPESQEAAQEEVPEASEEITGETELQAEAEELDEATEFPPQAPETGDEHESGTWAAESVEDSADEIESQQEAAETLPEEAIPAEQPDERSEEEIRHEDARRFARLLVSEIKLYNPETVEEGRRQQDLYARLQRDIERSREMYSKRVHPSVKVDTDYFHQELVRILAQDQEEALGSDYPGPDLEA